MILNSVVAIVLATMLAPQGSPAVASQTQTGEQQAATPQTQTGGPQAATLPAPAQPDRSAPGSYLIGPQDQLVITVFGEDDLTSKYRVDDAGTVSFPLLGRIPAAGLTLSEFQDRLTAQLANGYLRNPQVRVDIDQFRSQYVFVGGEVRTPGKIPMSGPTMTLLEVLALAGSPTTSASNEIIVVHPRKPNTAGTTPGDVPEGEEIRVNLKDLQLGRAGQDVVLRDGDIINVPKASTFYIMGQVKNGGTFVLEPGMTVLQAISLAGGLSERGSDRRIRVRRIVKGKEVEVDVRLEDKVQANDVIVVPSRFF